MGDFFGSVASLFSILNIPLGYILEFFYNLTQNYGVALILFTIFTRIFLFPLAVKSQRGSAEMLRLKPKQDMLNKKYEKDKARLNEELQKLYAEEGYNPLSGCLPMLIQLPILAGLIGVIYKPLAYIFHFTDSQVKQIVTVLTPEIELILNHKINAADSQRIEIIAAKVMNSNAAKVSDIVSTHANGLNFNFLGLDLSSAPHWLTINPLLLIPVLIYVAQFFSSYFSMKLMTITTPGQNNMFQSKSMLVLMPLMTTYFSFQVPAGIGLYWIMTSLLMIVQVLLLNKFYNAKELAAKSEEAALKRKGLSAGISVDTAQEQIPDQTSNETASDTPAPAQLPVRTYGGKMSKKQIKEANRKKLAQSRKNEQKALNDKNNIDGMK